MPDYKTVLAEISREFAECMGNEPLSEDPEVIFETIKEKGSVRPIIYFIHEFTRSALQEIRQIKNTGNLTAAEKLRYDTVNGDIAYDLESAEELNPELSGLINDIRAWIREMKIPIQPN